MEYNIYCDESCHLKSNKSNYMLIGAISCPITKVKKVNSDIKKTKEKYNLSNNIELKWNKVDKKTEELYIEIVNYFFHSKELEFRVIVIDNRILNHTKYNQTANDFYHKIYYDMLKYIIKKENCYNIYPDIKDTNSYYYHQVMLKYLRKKIKDNNNTIIKKVQPIRSYESSILQINDILLGALSYYYRKLNSNDSKIKVIKEIQKNYNFPLNKTTYNNKFNILMWRPNNDNN